MALNAECGIMIEKEFEVVGVVICIKLLYIEVILLIVVVLWGTF